MDSNIIVEVLILVGVIISSVFGYLGTSKKINYEIKTQLAVFQTKLDELTREVREHNNFARRMPLAEKSIEVLEREMKEIKRERKQ